MPKKDVIRPMKEIIVEMFTAVLYEDRAMGDALADLHERIKNNDSPMHALADAVRAHRTFLEAVTGPTSRFVELLQSERSQTRGRKRGSLSSWAEPAGTTVDNILDQLKEAQRAREAQDGSFAQLCRDLNIPESTMRSRLDSYADMIDRE